MGRRKITIQQITDPKLRNITYNKRKNGLIKKAAEISLLCNINLMLVFEDLNGTLVQFSRSKIKNIANFPKECNYKRVLELTSEDYPNFSRIKRHKKQANPEDVSFKTAKTNIGKNARSLEQMYSEHESMMGTEDVFSTDIDLKNEDFDLALNMITETPESSSNLSDGDFIDNLPSTLGFQPDRPKKVLKGNSQNKSTGSRRSNNQKETKNKLGLRLNIPKTEEDTVQDALKIDSMGSKRKGSSNSNNTNSSQKNYTRRAYFGDGFKLFDKKMETTASPFQMMGLDGYNQLNIKLVNMFNSPFKDGGMQRNFKNFMGEEEIYTGPQFSEFSFPMLGATPPILRQKTEDFLPTEKVGNYLSHSGRTPMQQQNDVFTFQPAEFQRSQEGGVTFDPAGYGMEGDNNSSKKNFWELQLSSGKMGNGIPSGGMSGHQFKFEGFFFGNDDNMGDWGKLSKR